MDAARGVQGTPVVTFYSYKGGVGRSMALANIAVLAARDHGLNVIAVDWDLEAPGLHRFFGLQDADVRDGVIDYLCRYKDMLRDSKRNITSDDLLLERSLMPVDKFPSGGSVRLLAAGAQANASEYTEKVTAMNWDDLYREWNGAQLIESIRQQLKAAAQLVLIDSRTGITDVGGICTMQLPDVVVLVFSFNEQNLVGTERIARELSRENETFKTLGRRPDIMLLPSRKEVSEIDRLRTWERKAAQQLKPYIASLRVARNYEDTLDYIRRSAVPYIPYFAYGEELAAKSEKGIELTDAFQPLTRMLTGKEPTLESTRSTDRGHLTEAENLAALIDAAPLSNTQRQFLQSRWLSRIVTLNRQAATALRRDLVLQFATTLCAIASSIGLANVFVLPLEFRTQVLLSLSGLAAAGVLTRQIMNLDDRGRSDRKLAASQEEEGLQFLQLIGPYRPYKSVSDAYATFLERLDHEIQATKITPATPPIDGTVIGDLKLTDVKKTFLYSRWLEQVRLIERNARRDRRAELLLRAITTTAAVAVPFLFSLDVGMSIVAARLFVTVLSILSFLVAAGTMAGSVFRFGDRWKANHLTAEALKTEGWQFSQLAGFYRGWESHESAYASFAERIETIIQSEGSARLWGDPSQRA